MITLWSVLSGSLWFILFTVALWLLRGRTKFLTRYGVAIWTAGTLMATARILFPFDSERAVVVESYRVLVAVGNFYQWEFAPGVTVRLVLLSLWALGAVVGLGWITAGILTNRRRLRRMPRAPKSQALRAAEAELGLAEDRVMVTGAVCSPVAVGILRPVICLPAVDYAPGDLTWILRHEATHIAHRDAWWRLGYRLFRCVFWWNPFVHLAQRGVDELLELRCDRAVLKGEGEENQLEYVEALAREAGRVHSGRSRTFAGSSAFLASQNAGFLVRRAQLALAAPPRWSVLTGVALVLGVGLFLASYFVIFQPAGYPPDFIDGERVYVTSPETSYLVHTDHGKYEMWFREAEGDIQDGEIRAEAQQILPFSELEVYHRNGCCPLAAGDGAVP